MSARSNLKCVHVSHRCHPIQSNWFRCLLGPRYHSKLLFYTAVPLIVILLAMSIPTLLNIVGSLRCTCSAAAKQSVSATRNAARTFTSQVVFVLYPMSARTVLLAFKCVTYVDGSNNKASWLLEDKLLTCPLSYDDQYSAYYWYAVAMVLIVVIGWPLMSWVLMWPWQNPIQRMYSIREDGTFEPAEDARNAVGMLFAAYVKRHGDSSVCMAVCVWLCVYVCAARVCTCIYVWFAVFALLYALFVRFFI